jgi:hypothetical protein
MENSLKGTVTGQYQKKAFTGTRPRSNCPACLHPESYFALKVKNY